MIGLVVFQNKNTYFKNVFLHTFNIRMKVIFHSILFIGKHNYNYFIKISLQKCYLFRSKVVENMVFGSLREEVTGRF